MVELDPEVDHIGVHLEQRLRIIHRKLIILAIVRKFKEAIHHVFGISTDRILAALDQSGQYISMRIYPMGI